jgi:hypothetical protein
MSVPIGKKPESSHLTGQPNPARPGRRRNVDRIQGPGAGYVERKAGAPSG